MLAFEFKLIYDQIIHAPDQGKCIIDALNSLVKYFRGAAITTLTSIINLEANAKVWVKQKWLDNVDENSVRYSLAGGAHGVISNPNRLCGNYTPGSQTAPKEDYEKNVPYA